MAKPSSSVQLIQEPPEAYGSKKSLDLDELFGFSAARKKLEEPLHIETEEPSFLPYRVFINNVDSFHAKSISEFLADQTYGATHSPEDEGEYQEEEEGEDDTEGEMDDDNEEEGDEEGEKKKHKKDEKTRNGVVQHSYEIVGPVKDPDYKATESIKETITNTEDREYFLSQIMKCGFIIYDITRDPSQITEAKWTLHSIEKEMEKLKARGPKTFKRLKEVRVFILISTVMTWALTKPIDPEEPDLPFTEADYRKRKPHPNYKEHIALEKEVVLVGKKYPSKFKTLVICIGVTYGAEEDVLHFLFKMAWHNEQQLPLIQPGSNLVPLIHVNDLATLIHMFLETFPSKIKYVLAVEQSVSTLRSIVRAISKALSTGNMQKISREEAFLMPDITQELHDLLTVNLNMEPVYMVENINMKWVSEQGFVENIQQVVSEYKETRGLKPLNIFVHGPPASGKTTVAKKLCEHYKLHYLGIKEVIDDAIKGLKDTIERVKAKEKIQAEEELREEEEEIEEEEGLLQENLEDEYELLQEVEANRIDNGDRLDDQYVLRFYKERMLSHPLQNQGFVLDGFPKTMEQAKMLFEVQEEDEEVVEEDEGDMQTSKNIMPEFVVSLEATDEFLCERVMVLPEKEVQGTHYVEEAILRRLAEFRAINTDDNTVLNYLDELEVHPLLLSVADDPSSGMQETVQRIIAKIGEPRNYGPSPHELDVIAFLEEETKKVVESEELRKRQVMERKLHEERLSKMEDWASLMDALHEEEEELISVRATPLRHYLVKYIFPTLTRGLLEVAHVRPADPVDYLAEYLFKENPEGKMFQPEYATAAEELLQAVHQFQDSLIKMDVLTNEDPYFLHSSTDMK